MDNDTLDETLRTSAVEADETEEVTRTYLALDAEDEDELEEDTRTYRIDPDATLET